MKIYIQDHRWAGSCVVVATSLEDARLYMATHATNFQDNLPILEYPIIPGFVFENLGDS